MKKKTRIAIWYDNRHGRNDGPPLYYFEALKRLPNTEVMHLIPGGENLADYGKFDYHFWVDWGEDAVLGRDTALGLLIPKDGGKTIYIASDTHLDDGYRFEKAKQFDYVFFNQMNAAHEFNKIVEYPHRNASYLPHAAEPIAYPKFEILKKYDLCFIGHIQEYHKGNGINMTRVDVLDHMFKKFPNFYFGSRNPVWPEKNMFEDAAKRFCESKVVFNISIGDDANMRFFETLITGSLLLTNDIPELKNLESYGFFQGRHYETYHSLEEAEQMVQYYIENDKEREVIAKAGYHQALKNGTYKSRIDEILKIVRG